MINAQSLRLKLKNSLGRWNPLCTILLMLKTNSPAWPSPKTYTQKSFSKLQDVGPEYIQNASRAGSGLLLESWRGRGPISEHIFSLRHFR